MKVQRGDVVLMDVPFFDRPGSKIRPMLVVQCDANNDRMVNTIVATITTNTARSSERAQVLIDMGSPAGRGSGLLATSVVSCENLVTVRRDRIKRVIGRICLLKWTMRSGHRSDLCSTPRTSERLHDPRAPLRVAAKQGWPMNHRLSH